MIHYSTTLQYRRKAEGSKLKLEASKAKDAEAKAVKHQLETPEERQEGTFPSVSLLGCSWRLLRRGRRDSGTFPIISRLGCSWRYLGRGKTDFKRIYNQRKGISHAGDTLV